MVKRAPDSGRFPCKFDTDLWPGGPIGGWWLARWLVAGSVARGPIGGPWPDRWLVAGGWLGGWWLARWPVARSVAGGWLGGPWPDPRPYTYT